ncbi:DUF2017 domain-containing protein [Streptomyces aidingensis]|uniref:Uncharacterized protein n=1 Tax=Streptomyces aidingensis TaxID=910347 RepID=A0A1I1RF61_9ACTN|nr:DUF2017 domain-containing protein [Streptomyces aidingensis]SFD33026.1 protein of unknown function [Streptomyces aidingensis]
MAAYFERAGGAAGGAAIVLDPMEISILRSLATQLLELIGPGEEPENGSGDPLDALFAEGPSKAPDDPALARLFPDAYRGPGEPEQDAAGKEQSAEFRRFTEGELRSRKRADILALVRTLDAATSAADGEGVVLTLEPAQSRQWLGALNDLRLAIAVRLDIDDEQRADQLFELPDDHPAKPLVMAYLWLGALQESLLETLLS